MRLLIALVLLAALGWSAYWFLGARALERAIRNGIDEARSRGVEIETAALNVTGFPNRFDTMVADPVLRFDPSGIAWSAPFLQVFALSYRPNQIIAALPPTQTLEGSFGSARIETESAKASATFRPNADLTLDHANLVVKGLRAAMPSGPLTLSRLLAATRLPEAAEDGRQDGRDDGRVHRIGVTVEDLDFPRSLAARLGGAGPARIDGATLDATATFSAPLDRKSLRGAAPLRVERIELHDLDIDWGGLTIAGRGTLDIDAGGRPRGQIDMTVRNWSRALEIAVATGLVSGERRGTAEQALSVVAALSGEAGVLTAPLAFREGGMFLGPVPLGPAPRFR